MSSPSGPRSIRISDDERGGWSSDRPRRGPARPADLTVRCRVLRPADRLRYAPGSLLVLVSPSAADRDRFVERVVEDRGAILSRDRVRRLLEGRVDAAELEDRVGELLQAAAAKRLTAGDSVVLLTDSLDADEREPFVRLAAGSRRPRHLVLLEASREDVAEEDRSALNALRRALDAGELGAEGFQTALRVGGRTAEEVKRIVFRPPPSDD